MNAAGCYSSICFYCHFTYLLVWNHEVHVCIVDLVHQWPTSIKVIQSEGDISQNTKFLLSYNIHSHHDYTKFPLSWAIHEKYATLQYCEPSGTFSLWSCLYLDYIASGSRMTSEWWIIRDSKQKYSGPEEDVITGSYEGTENNHKNQSVQQLSWPQFELTIYQIQAELTVC